MISLFGSFPHTTLLGTMVDTRPANMRAVTARGGLGVVGQVVEVYTVVAPIPVRQAGPSAADEDEGGRLGVDTGTPVLLDARPPAVAAVRLEVASPSVEETGQVGDAPATGIAP